MTTKMKGGKKRGRPPKNVGVSDLVSEPVTSSTPQPDQQALNALEAEPEKPPETTPKERKKRRSADDRKLEELQALLPRPLVIAVIRFPYAMAAQHYGPHWDLSEAEAGAMVESHLLLAGEYLPEFFQRHPALYAVLFQHALAILVRATMRAPRNEVQAATTTEGTPTNGDSGLPGQTGERQIYQIVKGSGE